MYETEKHNKSPSLKNANPLLADSDIHFGASFLRATSASLWKIIETGANAQADSVVGTYFR